MQNIPAIEKLQDGWKKGTKATYLSQGVQSKWSKSFQGEKSAAIFFSTGEQGSEKPCNCIKVEIWPEYGINKVNSAEQFNKNLKSYM